MYNVTTYSIVIFHLHTSQLRKLKTIDYLMAINRIYLTIRKPIFSLQFYIKIQYLLAYYCKIYASADYLIASLLYGMFQFSGD